MKKIKNIIKTKKKYINTLIKTIGLCAVFASTFLLFVNVTGAWFTQGEITSNTKNMGTIAVESSSINNPFIYDGTVTSIPVTITNLSNVHVVAKAYINIAWNNNKPIDNYNIVLANNNFTLGNDNFYYCNFILNPSGETGDTIDFLSAVEIIDTENKQLGKKFEVNVYVEVAQQAYEAYIWLWESAPSEWSNILS